MSAEAVPVAEIASYIDVLLNIAQFEEELIKEDPDIL